MAAERFCGGKRILRMEDYDDFRRGLSSGTFYESDGMSWYQSDEVPIFDIVIEVEYYTNCRDNARVLYKISNDERRRVLKLISENIDKEG